MDVCQKKASVPALKLVTSFDVAAYRYPIRENLSDPMDSRVRSDTLRLLKAGIEITGIKDYFLIESHHDIVLYLKTEGELCDMGIAMQPYDEISQKMSIQPEDFEYRKVKNRKNRMAEKLKRTDLRGKISVTVDRKEKAIIIHASDKKSYFRFWQMMESGIFDYDQKSTRQLSL